ELLSGTIGIGVCNLACHSGYGTCLAIGTAGAASGQSLSKNTDRNEFLVAAQRSKLGDILRPDSRSSGHYYLLESILGENLIVGQILLDTDDYTFDPADTSYESQLKVLVKQNTRSGRPSQKHMDKTDIAHRCLAEIQSGIAFQKTNVNKILDLWSKYQKEELHENIEKHFLLAVDALPLMEIANNLANQYAGAFARIECRLVAASDLEKYNLLPKIVEEPSLGDGTFFSLLSAEWADNKDLVVKKIK
ncbi:unnamed protein product, partial [Didymodactylos carnosus]